MGTKLKNAPLYFVISQVRFNKILELSKFLPEIQSHFRMKGYTIYNQVIQQSFDIEVSDTEGLQKVTPQSATQYHFGNASEDAFFILNDDSISLQVTNYDTFEIFVKQFLEGLSIINQCVMGGLSSSERVGLRTLDAVTEQKNPLGEQLEPRVLGLKTPTNGTFNTSFVETNFKVDQVSLVARAITRKGKLGLSADLSPSPVKFLPKFEQIDQLHCILDIDGFTIERKKFDLFEIERTMQKIHTQTSKTFAEMTTEKALDSWA